MDELVRQEAEEKFIEYFVPGHLTKGLIASGISAGASLVALGFGAYALKEFRQVKAEEILALLGKY